MAQISLAKILVVEDEHIVALHLQHQLADMGYLPAVAYSGEAAIEKARTTIYDLVLMDIRLRGAVDGIEAAREIRSSHDVPIIYLTAFADDETLERARTTQPYSYIVKPFQEAELKASIEVALDRHATSSKRAQLDDTRAAQASLKQRELERAVRMRDDIATVVRDQLRFPLEAIRANAEHLASTESGQSIIRSLELVRLQLDDLVDATAITEAKLELERAVCSVSELGSEVVDSCRMYSELRDITVATVFPDARVVVSCDRERMLQALTTLLRNAIRFTPRSGTVTMRVELLDSRISFEIRDSGGGIPAAKLPRLFDRFPRDQGRRTAVGFGLYVASGIVAAHGGTLVVESTPRGTRFAFSLNA